MINMVKKVLNRDSNNSSINNREEDFTWILAIFLKILDRILDLGVNKEQDNKNLQILIQVQMILLLEPKNCLKKCSKKVDLMIWMMMNFKKNLIQIVINKISRKTKQVIYFFLYGPMFSN